MKTHDSYVRSRRATSIIAGPAVLAALALLGLGALGACGSSSSSSSNAFGEFSGTWRVNLGTGTVPLSTFQLSCPMAQISGSLMLWDRFVLEPGTLSDLIETSGPSDCQFGFDVDATGKVASVTTADPYTMAVPECTVFVPEISDAAGDSFFLDLKPSQWTFMLLQPVKGAPPPGQLVGAATGTLVVVSAMTGMASTADPACTYAVSAMFNKLSK
jgi:hypothetical protein